MTGALAATLAALSTTAALLLLVPVGVLVLQALGYLFGRGSGPRPLSAASGDAPRLAVLMPAHNEEQVIARGIAAVLPQLRAGDRLLVVADNCTDATAQIAEAAGAEVTVRSDTSHRGKGYALDWGVQALHVDPPDVVVIIDADCEIDAGSLERLAALSAASGRPVQASYLMDLPEVPTLKLRVAAFAWMLKTQFRALGYHRLGLPCQLMGTGMAFPWGLIRNAPLASGNIVEDVQLGVDLAIAGHAPVFCPQAVVHSWFPAQGTAVQTQRTRWEHGHLNTLRTQVPRLLSAALGACSRQRTELAAIAWDLSVPPLAFLTLLLVASVSANAAVWLAQGPVAGLATSALGLATLAFVIAVTWRRMGRAVISPLQLLSVPLYVVAKIPMYLRLLLGRGQTDWVRTDRKKKRQ